MIVTYQYFTDVFLGKGVSSTDFPRLEIRSEDLLNSITRGALDKFSTFDERVQADIKRALCYQVEYYSEYGLNVGYAEEERGFTVGKVTVQGGAMGNGYKTYVSPMAVGLLERHGLLCRSVGVRC